MGVTSLPAAIPRLDRSKASEKLLDTVTPQAVLIGIDRARRLLKNDETAHTAYPGSVVITTTSVADSVLENMTAEMERNIVRLFNPDYHLPGDNPVYWDHGSTEQTTRVQQTLRISRQLESDLAEQSTELIPLVKGMSPGDRELCYDFAVEKDASIMAYYVTQYFSSGNGANIQEALKNINTICDELPNDMSLLVVGFASPEYLQFVNGSVTAAAGFHQWFKRVDSASSETGVQNAYNEFVDGVTEALD